MKLSSDQLNELFERNPELARRNPGLDSGGSARNSRSVAKLERDPRNAALESAQIKKCAGQRVFVRVTSFRRRLLDEDNLCEKYHVDLCRYAGIISADSPGEAKIEVCQIKVGKGEREFVQIEIG